MGKSTTLQGDADDSRKSAGSTSLAGEEDDTEKREEDEGEEDEEEEASIPPLRSEDASQRESDGMPTLHQANVMTLDSPSGTISKRASWKDGAKRSSTPAPKRSSVSQRSSILRHISKSTAEAKDRDSRTNEDDSQEIQWSASVLTVEMALVQPGAQSGDEEGLSAECAEDHFIVAKACTEAAQASQKKRRSSLFIGVDNSSHQRSRSFFVPMERGRQLSVFAPTVAGDLSPKLPMPLTGSAQLASLVKRRQTTTMEISKLAPLPGSNQLASLVKRRQTALLGSGGGAAAGEARQVLHAPPIAEEPARRKSAMPTSLALPGKAEDDEPDNDIGVSRSCPLGRLARKLHSKGGNRSSTLQVSVALNPAADLSVNASRRSSIETTSTPHLSPSSPHAKGPWAARKSLKASPDRLSSIGDRHRLRTRITGIYQSCLEVANCRIAVAEAAKRLNQDVMKVQEGKRLASLTQRWHAWGCGDLLPPLLWIPAAFLDTGHTKTVLPACVNTTSELVTIEIGRVFERRRLSSKSAREELLDAHSDVLQKSPYGKRSSLLMSSAIPQGARGSIGPAGPGSARNSLWDAMGATGVDHGASSDAEMRGSGRDIPGGSRGSTRLPSKNSQHGRGASARNSMDWSKPADSAENSIHFESEQSIQWNSERPGGAQNSARGSFDAGYMSATGDNSRALVDEDVDQRNAFWMALTEAKLAQTQALAVQKEVASLQAALARAQRRGSPGGASASARSKGGFLGSSPSQTARSRPRSRRVKATATTPASSSGSGREKLDQLKQREAYVTTHVQDVERQNQRLLAVLQCRDRQEQPRRDKALQEALGRIRLRLLDGTELAVNLRGARHVHEVRARAAAALGIPDKDGCKIKLTYGDVLLDDLPSVVRIDGGTGRVNGYYRREPGDFNGRPVWSKHGDGDTWLLYTALETWNVVDVETKAKQQMGQAASKVSEGFMHSVERGLLCPVDAALRGAGWKLWENSGWVWHASVEVASQDSMCLMDICPYRGHPEASDIELTVHVFDDGLTPLAGGATLPQFDTVSLLSYNAFSPRPVSGLEADSELSSSAPRTFEMLPEALSPDPQALPGIQARAEPRIEDVSSRSPRGLLLPSIAP